MPMPSNEIEAQLSYAYLHAVAARAGLGCKVTSRHEDNVGLDAELRVLEELLDPGSTYTNFSFDMQLKATTKPSPRKNGRYPYFLQEVQRYDRLRARAGPFPTFLVVMFLPTDPKQWLEHSEKSLIARRCAYWVSLWDAPACKNATGQTVYLPQENVLSVDGLRDLARRLSCEEVLTYAD